jgi:hypothetical protein
MTRDEVNEISEEAAKKALQSFFLTLGVDVTDPKAVIRMQDDLRFLGNWRESTEAVKRKTLMTAVGFIVTGALGWLAVLLYHK